MSTNILSQLLKKKKKSLILLNLFLGCYFFILFFIDAKAYSSNAFGVIQNILTLPFLMLIVVSVLSSYYLGIKNRLENLPILFWPSLVFSTVILVLIIISFLNV